jgi:parvulin-like peptidyl-prolyl isomerase
VLVEPNQAVVTVDGEPITVAEYQERVRVERLREITQLRQAIELNNIQTSLDSMFQVTRLQLRLKQAQESGTETNEIGKEVLDQMIKEVLVRQEARRRGLAASDEDIQRRIEENVGYYRHGTPTPFPTPTPVPNPSATPTLPFTPIPITPGTPEPRTPPLPTVTPLTEAGFQRILEESVAEWGAVGFTETDLRRLVEAQVLEQKLRDALATELPNPDEHVQGSFITFRSEADAQPVVDRLNAGEDFTKLMEEVRSGKLGVSGRPGQIPWLPRGSLAPRFGDEFEQHAFDTPVGGHSRLFADKDGRYFIIYIADRQVRELDPFSLQLRKDTLFNQWLEERRKAAVTIGDDWKSHVPLDPALPPELAATPRPPSQ